MLNPSLTSDDYMDMATPISPFNIYLILKIVLYGVKSDFIPWTEAWLAN